MQAFNASAATANGATHVPPRAWQGAHQDPTNGSNRVPARPWHARSRIKDKLSPACGKELFKVLQVEAEDFYADAQL